MVGARKNFTRDVAVDLLQVQQSLRKLPRGLRLRVSRDGCPQLTRDIPKVI